MNYEPFTSRHDWFSVSEINRHNKSYCQFLQLEHLKSLFVLSEMLIMLSISCFYISFLPEISFILLNIKSAILLLFFGGARQCVIKICSRSCQSAAAHSRQTDTKNKINNFRVNISSEIQDESPVSSKRYMFCMCIYILVKPPGAYAVPEWLRLKKLKQKSFNYTRLSHSYGPKHYVISLSASVHIKYNLVVLWVDVNVCFQRVRTA